jgi:hypothetical protein
VTASRQPEPAVPPSNSDVTPCAHTPTRDPTTPHTCNPVSPTTPVTAPPQVPVERAPTMIVHGLCDLSGLHSDTHNPWSTLCRHHHYSHPPCDFSLHSNTLNQWATQCHHRSQKPHHPVHRNHHLFKYPTNIFIHSPLKLQPLGVFKTIRHPHGIGPTKPVIRVPAQMATDTPANLMPPVHHTIVKSALPSLLLQSDSSVENSFVSLMPYKHATFHYITLYVLYIKFYFTIFIPLTVLCPFHVFVGDEGITLKEGGTCGSGLRMPGILGSVGGPGSI